MKIYAFKTNLNLGQNCFLVLGSSPENAKQNFEKDLKKNFQPELAQKIFDSITTEGKEFDPENPDPTLLNELYEITENKYFTPGN